MRGSVKDICEIHELGPGTQEWMVAGERVTSAGGKCPRFTGYTVAGRGYRFGRLTPRFAQVLVTESGEGLVLVDGEWRTCPAGYAYLTAPRVTSAYHIKPGSGAWRLHWSIYGEECLLPSLPPGAPSRLVPVEATSFRHAVEGYCHEKGSRADPGVLGLWAALVDHAVWRMLDAEQGDPRLDRLWLAVRQDIGGTWTLRRMAREAGSSEESLRRLCQKHFKRAPMAQLARMRMHAAADFLRHSDEKFDALAARLGYSDAFAFSTAFRREWGLPPSRYRERNFLGGSSG
ncbi:MAG: AraC family transcriptional regulator [Opitutae bacterium]|nr:AraC family transcriptional regulator [Opitutae bacterium]